MAVKIISGIMYLSLAGPMNPREIQVTYALFLSRKICGILLGEHLYAELLARTVQIISGII